MTASQIIREIESLPPQQQEEVIRFVVRLERQCLTGTKLTAMAEALVGASPSPAADSLKQELEQGFYGK